MPERGNDAPSMTCLFTTYGQARLILLPLGFLQGLGVSLDPEASETGEEVTQLDHFTFLGVLSELLLSLLESRERKTKCKLEL